MKNQYLLLTIFIAYNVTDQNYSHIEERCRITKKGGSNNKL
jgi:hypothetical protein